MAAKRGRHHAGLHQEKTRYRAPLYEGLCRSCPLQSDQSEGGAKITEKYLAIKDDKSIDEAYNEIVVKLTRRVPYPTEPGIQLFLDQLKTKNPKAGQVKPSEFTDISFLKELETSGYIDRLYK